MKRLFTSFCLLLLAGVCFLPGGVQAAYVDLRPDGIAMTSDGQSYDPGDNDVMLQVWVMPSGPEDVTLDGWAIDIWFDASETLDYQRTQSQNILPGPSWFTITSPGNVIKDASPYVQNLEGFTFDLETIPFTPSGVHIADLFFTFDRASLGADGLPDFTVYYRPGQSLLENGSFEEFKPGSIGPDLAPVPIPAAVYLFGSGLIGLVGIRRRMAA
ncbi:MAG: VPLPA-CTERM sorting domain-containing protein [Deltaproteobacteria bacterium]|nr:VPLPA-CTERM sorting domain-containing protein [Deltaproteobacteria bacterium]